MVPSSRSSFFGSGMAFTVFLIWFFGCLGLYFLEIPLHPIQRFQYLFFSFETSQWQLLQILQAWLEHGYFLISLIGTLIVFIGTGNRIIRPLGPWAIHRLEDWVWSLALGWLFWGLLAEGLATEKLLFPHLLMGLGL